MISASALLASGLTACGGADGAGGDIAAVSKAENAASETPGAQASTASSFFDDIFLNEDSGGYFYFAYNSVGSPGVSTGLDSSIGISQLNLFAKTDEASALKTKATPLTGNNTLQYSNIAYITSEGVFPTSTLPYDDLGLDSKVFQKLPDGYEFGVKGMSVPLYRVSLSVQDISGQTIAEATSKMQGFSEPMTRTLPRLVFPSNDPSTMPQGSRLYMPTYEAQTTFLRVKLNTRTREGVSLEQVINELPAAHRDEMYSPIQSLGGVRYLKIMGRTAIYLLTSDDYLVEYDGALYTAERFSPGDRPSAVAVENRYASGTTSSTIKFSEVSPRPAYNKTAFDFLVKKLGTTPKQAQSTYLVLQ